MKIITIVRLLFLFYALYYVVFFVFTVQPELEHLFILAVGIWYLALLTYRAKAQITFISALFLLSMTPLFLIFQNYLIAEKIATVAYLMLLIGTLQGLVELLLGSRFLYDYHYLYQKVVQNELTQYVLLFIKISIHSIHRLTVRFIHAVFDLQPKTILHHLLNLFKLGILLLVVFYLGYNSTVMLQRYGNYIKVERQKKYRLSLNPQISKVEPKYVYAANKVIIFGKNFGWKESDSSLLIKDSGKAKEGVTTDLWTDTKIIFVVPLNWKNGEIRLWIEKPVMWDTTLITAKSNAVNIKIIPRTDPNVPNSPDDEAYVEQMKYLDPETLQINGL